MTDDGYMHVSPGESVGLGMREHVGGESSFTKARTPRAGLYGLRSGLPPIGGSGHAPRIRGLRVVIVVVIIQGIHPREAIIVVRW